MIKKLIIITLLIFLVRIPVYGHDMDYDTWEKGNYNNGDYCDLNPDYQTYEEYEDEINKIEYKRELHYHKCILKHSRKESSMPSGNIKRACEFLANDKYEKPISFFKNYENSKLRWLDKTTGEITSFTNCHPHE